MHQCAADAIVQRPSVPAIVCVAYQSQVVVGAGESDVAKGVVRSGAVLFVARVRGLACRRARDVWRNRRPSMGPLASSSAMWTVGA